MDITGLQALEEAVQSFEARGVRVVLCEANPRVLRKLVRTGLVRRDAEPVRYYGHLGLAIAACAS